MGKRFAIILSALLAVSACISNDLPYPMLVPHITSVTADGTTDVNISQDKRAVTLTLAETTDPKKVRIREVAIDVEDDLVHSDRAMTGVFDMTKPQQFDLDTYPGQSYQWTFTALNPIERYFTVNGQVGSTTIDEVNRRAIAYVGKNVDRSNVQVTSLKLGPAEITTYSKKMEQMKDFDNGVDIDVTVFGETATWTLFVDATDAVVELKDINPWTREVYLTSTGVAGKKNGFRYRIKGDTDWTTVAESDITASGGTFVAHVNGLRPATDYEVQAFCDSDYTQTYEFTTDPATPLPNHSFEDVSLVTGQSYYKWYNPYAADPDSRYMFWGSGNGEGPDGINGTASLGITLTFPDAAEAQDGHYAVRCESKSFAGLLACGNIFLGQFSGLVGTTGGKVNYGRPWKTRPKALRFKMKYNCGIVDLVGSYPPDDPVKVGDPDRCHIIATVGDWDYRIYGGSKDNPVLVNTTAGIYFTKESPGIIGYGEYIRNESTNGWIEMEIPIEYRSLTRKPTHIIVICAASIRGDYLTGSSRTTLWVDDFDLIY